jgi:diketogulonate reductase-like aldo/keto reductase
MDTEGSKERQPKSTPTGLANVSSAAVGAEPTVEEKLRLLLGGVEVGGEAAPAYMTICDHFAQKMSGRIPTKPIDLTHVYEGADRRVSPELLAALRVAMGAKLAAELGAALETLWQRVLPKIGIGTMGLTAKVTPGEQPLKAAYENGVRLFPLMDPLTMMGPMGAKINNLEVQGNDLRDCDLSTADVFLSSAPQIFVKADATPEEIRGVIRRSFDTLRKELGPLKVGDGQPVLDGYTLFMPMLIGFPGKVPLLDALPFGELWAEMEALVDEGLVRAIGISNHTTHQIDALLASATVRHRPAWVQQERHVHNQINDFKAFCDARKLPLMAAVPLATGDVLDSSHLAHPEMTPAQAALHWNVSQGVAVIPGADCIAHVVENAATASKLHLTPVAPPEPTEPNRKVYPIWPALSDLWFETGTDADLGTFVTGTDGLLRCAKREMAATDPRLAASLEKIDLGPAEVKRLALLLWPSIHPC